MTAADEREVVEFDDENWSMRIGRSHDGDPMIVYFDLTTNPKTQVRSMRKHFKIVKQGRLSSASEQDLDENTVPNQTLPGESGLSLFDYSWARATERIYRSHFHPLLPKNDRASITFTLVKKYQVISGKTLATDSTGYINNSSLTELQTWAPKPKSRGKRTSGAMPEGPEKKLKLDPKRTSGAGPAGPVEKPEQDPKSGGTDNHTAHTDDEAVDMAKRIADWKYEPPTVKLLLSQQLPIETVDWVDISREFPQWMRKIVGSEITFTAALTQQLYEDSVTTGVRVLQHPQLKALVQEAHEKAGTYIFWTQERRERLRRDLVDMESRLAKIPWFA